MFMSFLFRFILLHDIFMSVSLLLLLLCLFLSLLHRFIYVVLIPFHYFLVTCLLDLLLLFFLFFNNYFNCAFYYYSFHCSPCNFCSSSTCAFVPFILFCPYFCHFRGVFSYIFLALTLFHSYLCRFVCDSVLLPIILISIIFVALYLYFVNAYLFSYLRPNQARNV